MTDATSIANCQYCSGVSKANGEDPIGTAGNYEAFLLIEAKPLWSGAIWLAAGAMPQPVVNALQQAWERGLNLRPLAIAPDRTYSQPGWVRVFFYQRPADLFAQFERQEFVIPSNQLAELVTALLIQPEELPRFLSYQQTARLRDLFVCTHGSKYPPAEPEALESGRRSKRLSYPYSSHNFNCSNRCSSYSCF